MSQISVAEYEIRERTIETSAPDMDTNEVEEGVLIETTGRDTKQLPSLQLKSNQFVESDLKFSIPSLLSQLKANTRYKNENAGRNLRAIFATKFVTRTMVSSVRNSLGEEEGEGERERTVEEEPRIASAPDQSLISLAPSFQ